LFLPALLLAMCAALPSTPHPAGGPLQEQVRLEPGGDTALVSTPEQLRPLARKLVAGVALDPVQDVALLALMSLPFLLLSFLVLRAAARRSLTLLPVAVRPGAPRAPPFG
jgi:hypothetical protein